MHKNKQEIIDYHAEVEAEATELLEETGSDFTLDDVKNVIYNEEESDDFQKVIAMFDDGNPENLSNIIETVTDAWNYFPHKLTNGLSPTEVLFEYEQKNKNI